MKNGTCALLVHHEAEPLGTLKLALLDSEPIEIRRAGNCREVVQELEACILPHLIFTDIVLPDGTWAEVLRLAAQAREAVNVIVVAPLADIPLNIDAIGRGAFDFIVPPFAWPDLDRLVNRAAWDVLARRQGLVEATGPAVLICR